MSKAPYEVNITSADNGIIVRVGCKTLVFGTSQVIPAMQDIQEYLTGGHKAYQRLHQKYFPLDKIDNGPNECAPQPEMTQACSTGRDYI